MAFPPPLVTTQQRRLNLRRTIRPLQRVLSKECHSFLSEWLEKASQLSLAKPFGFGRRASIESTDRCRFPLPCVTTSVADPSVGLEGRDPRDREVYTLIESLDQLFVCFIFSDDEKFFRETRRLCIPQQNAGHSSTSFISITMCFSCLKFLALQKLSSELISVLRQSESRFRICSAARKIPSNRPSFGAARHARANAARSG